MSRLGGFNMKEQNSKWKLYKDNSYKRLLYPYYCFEDSQGKRLLVHMRETEPSDGYSFYGGTFAEATEFEDGLALIGAGAYTMRSDRGIVVPRNDFPEPYLWKWMIVNEQGEVIKEFLADKDIYPIRIGGIFLGVDYETKKLIAYDSVKDTQHELSDEEISFFVNG